MADPYAPPPWTPRPDARGRIHAAIARRNETDYVFDFWTAFGWTLLTCGGYSFYVIYKLMQRSVEHNRRRLELLTATNEWAWERAVAAGRHEELTPAFQGVAQHLGVLQRVSGEFREPAIWVLMSIVASGIANYVAYVLLDRDLVDHERAEWGAEAELSAILRSLDVDLAPANEPTKTRHDWVGRVFATIGSCGLYGLWWLADVMRDLNDHYLSNWWWEDRLHAAVSTT